MAKITDELLIRIHALVEGQGDVRELERAIAGMERQAQQSVPDPSKGVGANAPAATSRLKELAQAVAGLLAALGAANAVSGVLETGKAFENLLAQLTTLQGSSAAADKSLKWIADFTAKTPFELLEVAEGFRKLKAFGLDPIANDTLLILGNTASAMGKTLNDAVEMLADAVTGEFERLKEFGVKASQEGDKVRFAYTKNGQAMVLEAEKNSAAIQKAILEGIFNEKYAGGMEALSQTLSGKLSGISDQWVAFERAIADAGFFDLVKGEIEGLVAEIQRMTDSGELQAWAQGISDALTALMTAVKTVGTVIGGLAPIIGFLAAPVTQAINNFITLTNALRELGEGAGEQEQKSRDLADTLALLQARAREALVDNAKYADVLVQSAAAVEGMAKTERVRYLEGLEGARKYADALAIVRKEQGDTSGAAAALTAANQYRAALTDLAPLLQKISTLEVKDSLGPAVAALIKQFGDLYTKSGRVGEALQGILAPLQRGDTDFITLNNAAIALKELEKQGKATGREVKTALVDMLKDLSADELDRLLEKLKKVPVVGVPGFEQLKAAAKSAKEELGKTKEKLAELKAPAPIKIEVDTGAIKSLQDAYTAFNALKGNFTRGAITAEEYAKGLRGVNAAVVALHPPIGNLAQQTETLTAAQRAQAEAAGKSAMEVTRLAATTNDLAKAQALEAIAATKAAQENDSFMASARSAAAGIAKHIEQVGLLALANARAEGAADVSAGAFDRLYRSILGGKSLAQVAGNFHEFYINIKEAAGEVTAAAVEQQNAYETLFRQVESGSLSLRDLDLALDSIAASEVTVNDASRGVVHGLGLIDQARLDNLTGQIEQVKRSMQALTAATEDQIFSEQQRRHRLLGDEISAKQAEFAKAEADLRKEIAANKNVDLRAKLSEQLRILESNNDLELQQLRAKEAERKKLERQADADRQQLEAKRQQREQSGELPNNQADKPKRQRDDIPETTTEFRAADAERDRIEEELHRRALARIEQQRKALLALRADPLNLTIGALRPEEIITPETVRRLILPIIAERARLRG